MRLRKKFVEVPSDVIEQKWKHINESIANVTGGMLNIRFSDPGSFYLTLHSSSDPAFIATAPPIVYGNTSLLTQHCKNEIVLKDDNEGVIHIGKPTPYYTVAGVISMNGGKGLTLPPHALLENTFASWTIQMWIYLMEDSTGQHRALFFKGPNPNDGHRTPSVWLNPHSRHLSLRMSTTTNLDTERQTPNELSLRTWTLLTFVFHNRSSVNGQLNHDAKSKAIVIPPVGEGSESSLVTPLNGDQDRNDRRKDNLAGDGAYSVYIYFNDLLELNVSYASEVLPNNGNLYLGKDPWFTGAKAMIGKIKLYNLRLSSYAIRKSFLESSFHNFQTYDEGVGVRSTKLQFEKSNPFTSKAALDVLAAVTIGEDIKLQLEGDVKAKQDCKESSKRQCDDTTSALDARYGIKSSDSFIGEQSLKDLYTMGNTMKLTMAEADDDAKTLYDEAKLLITKCEELARALDLLEAAGNLNHAEALYLGASLLLHGANAHAGDDSKCSELSMGALFNHADILDKSIEQLRGKLFGASEIEASSKRAYRLLLKAARLGSGDALWLLGVMHSSGLGIGGSENTDISPDGMEIFLRPDYETYATALYHLAALHDNTNAQLALAHRYQNGIGVEADCESAAFYYDIVSQKALEEHHSGGQEQIHSHKRLTLETEEHIDEGELGDEDERIEMQRLRAEQGHVPSMLAMGDLNYYGARGLARNQVEAQRWYRMAGSAPHNNANGQIGVGNMLLKGEGIDKNVTDAIIWYEKAAAQNHTRALNGLGFIYFVGGDVPQNQTKGYEYFKRAADKGDAGDSLFNAAHCLYEGQGVEQDVAAAIALFRRASQDFGHFPSVCKMGAIALMDKTHGRQCRVAVDYLRPAAHHGSWGNVVRRGFNNFLIKDYERSLIRYLEGSEMGYEVAQSNAAYILDRLYVDENSIAGRDANVDQGVATNDDHAKKNLQQLALFFYQKARKQGNHNHDLRLGDYYYYGMGGLKKNLTIAADYYRKASANGNAQGAYSLATMYERAEILAGGIVNDNSYKSPGVAEKRLAKKYFQRTLDLSPTSEVEVVVQLALSRMQWNDAVRKMFDRSTPWITKSMYKAFVGLTILIALVIVLLQSLFQRWRSNNMSNNEECDNSVHNGLENSSNIMDATTNNNPRREEEHSGSNARAASGDEMQVMLEYLKSLQNYKKLCAAVFLQRWFRKMQRKRSKRDK